MSDKITIAHGAGGQMSRNLLNDIILPAFSNPTLNILHDGAIINAENFSGKLAFTTDKIIDILL